MKFAVIGTSWITKSYIDGARDSGLWELGAVYSRSHEKGKEFASQFGCDTVYTNLDEFAKSDKFDAVYVASPNVLHYEHSKLLLENKKHVICEKSLVSYLWQAEELFQIAEKNNVIFMEAIMFMHLPMREKLEQAISKIGDISMASFDFCQRSSKYDDLLKGQLPNIFNPLMHTGALMDLGVYCLYPALYLWGEPKSYSVNLRKISTGADASGLISFDYDTMQVSIKFSKIGQTAGVSDIQGDLGTIKIESISKLVNMEIIYNNKEIEPICGDIVKEELMGNEAIDFYSFINDNDLEKYQICKKYSLLVMKYIEEIRKKANLEF